MPIRYLRGMSHYVHRHRANRRNQLLLHSLNVREMIRKPCLYNTTGANSQVVILSQDFEIDPAENPVRTLWFILISIPGDWIPAIQVTNSTPSKRMKGRYPVGFVLQSAVLYILVLTLCMMDQIQVNVEHSVVSMVDMNIDVPSNLNATSE